MQRLKRFIVSLLCGVCILGSVSTVFAATSYANHFTTWSSGGNYHCSFTFIGAHEIQSGEKYCTEVGKHVKQAYVIAYNSSQSTGRLYSSKATSMSDAKERTTPTASIKNTLLRTEYLKYGYSLF